MIALTGCKTTKYIPGNEYLLEDYSIKFEKKSPYLTKDELNTLVKQKPNHEIFNYFKLHLAIYNLIDPRKEQIRQRKRKERLEEINRKRRKKGKKPKEKTYITQWVQEIGEPPVIYDEHKTNATKRQMHLYLKNKGFYNAEIQTIVETQRKKADVTYFINPGRPYLISDIEYRIKDPDIATNVLKDTVNSLIKENNLFDVNILQDERMRITNLLKSKGYFAFSKEYIHYLADSTASDYSVKITLSIQNPVDKQNGTDSLISHKKYFLDSIYFYTDFDPKLSLQNRKKYLNSFERKISDTSKIIMLYSSEFRIKPQTILRENYLIPGDIYNKQKADRTYRNLNSLQAYKLINIYYEDKSTSDIDSGIINCHVQLTPFTRQSYTLELEGSNASGNWGVAGNLTYRHRNLFKGGENFHLRLRGAREAQTDVFPGAEDSRNDVFNTYEYGVETSIDFPKFMVPFKSEYYSRIYDLKTLFSFSYNYQNRSDYSRTLGGAKIGYYWVSKRSGNIKNFFNPFEFNLVNVTDQSQNFLDYIEDRFIRYSYTNQLISASNYTIIFDNIPLKNEKDKMYIRGMAELAGNILNLYSVLADETKNNGSYRLFDIRYAQYAKLDLDLRYYKSLERQDQMVFRLFNGYAYPYGNSKKGLPFVKKYYSGGANSIRAWQVRSLGPGSYHEEEQQKYLNQTADMKLEANFEYRFRMFWILEGAFFVDAGNIWAIRKSSDDRENALFRLDSFYKDIAVGSGLGLRLDFSFFIFRADIGLKLRDPSIRTNQSDFSEHTAPNKWIFTHRKYDRSDWNFNVGIGYPF